MAVHFSASRLAAGDKQRTKLIKQLAAIEKTLAEPDSEVILDDLESYRLFQLAMRKRPFPAHTEFEGASLTEFRATLGNLLRALRSSSEGQIIENQNPICRK